MIRQMVPVILEPGSLPGRLLTIKSLLRMRELHKQERVRTFWHRLKRRYLEFPDQCSIHQTKNQNITGGRIIEGENGLALAPVKRIAELHFSSLAF